jgi:hypothetical protein
VWNQLYNYHIAVNGINFDKDFDGQLYCNHHYTSAAAVRDKAAARVCKRGLRIVLPFQTLERGVEGESMQA